jgi:hypothetical protein
MLTNADIVLIDSVRVSFECELLSKQAFNSTFTRRFAFSGPGNICRPLSA